MTDTGSLEAQLAHWQQWVGRSEQRDDVVSASQLAGLSATLDRDDPAPTAGSEAPPLTHWLHFLPQALQREIGPDGHPHRGGFLPPVELPRRMWAGGRLEWHQPLRAGEAISRVSTIARVDAKEGRSGKLVFVTVRHEVSGPTGLAVTEEQDIVYREAAAPGAPAPAPTPAPDDAAFVREITPDPVLLFRYSALTFNGHKIHYDRPYCLEAEGSPGLVVHGPLIATLLTDLLRRERPEARLVKFAFTAVRPVFDINRFQVCGKPGEEPGSFKLWACDHEGALTMKADAEIA